MTHKLVLKVKNFQLSTAKRLGTVEENLQGGMDFTPKQFRDIIYWQVRSTDYKWGNADWKHANFYVKNKLTTISKPLAYVGLLVIYCAFPQGDTNQPVEKLACEKLACYLSATSNFRFFRFS